MQKRHANIFDPRATVGKKIKCVEKQVGWDIIHYNDGTSEPFMVPVTKGYKRGRVIL